MSCASSAHPPPDEYARQLETRRPMVLRTSWKPLRRMTDATER